MQGSTPMVSGVFVVLLSFKQSDQDMETVLCGSGEECHITKAAYNLLS